MHAQDKRTDTTHERSGSRRSSRPTPATGLLSLQGMAGNAAVTRAIQARRQEHAHVQHTQRPAVQNVLTSTARPLVTTLRTDVHARFGHTDFGTVTGLFIDHQPPRTGTGTTPVQRVDPECNHSGGRRKTPSGDRRHRAPQGVLSYLSSRPLACVRTRPPHSLLTVLVRDAPSHARLATTASAKGAERVPARAPRSAGAALSPR